MVITQIDIMNLYSISKWIFQLSKKFKFYRSTEILRRDLDYFNKIHILVCSITSKHEGHQPRSSVFVIIETFRLNSQFKVLNMRTMRVERAKELKRCTTLVQIQEPVLHVHNYRLLHGTINCRIFYICISYHLLMNFRQTPDKHLPARRRSVFPIIYMINIK